MNDSTAPPTFPTPPEPGLTAKHFTPAEINFTPGERSFVAWISMDVVDHEGDVVVPAGVDFESVYMGKPNDPTRPGNPVVMAVHDYQRWPLGTCEWIKVARPSKRLNFSGLYSKTLIDEDPDALKVFGMIQRRVVRGISIGFRPPEDLAPGEWGPPTPAERAARPDWTSARRVIRRCVLLEYSVVPIPMNQGALIVAVSKGLELPSYLQDKLEPPEHDHIPPFRTEAQWLAAVERHVRARLAAQTGRDRVLEEAMEQVYGTI